MYKKNIIYSLISILIVLVMLLVPTNIYAKQTVGTTVDEGGVVSPSGDTDVYDSDLGNLDKYKGAPMDSARLKEIAGKILSVIQIVGTVVSVVMLIVIGIKYMLGSVEEKAEYKSTLVPYVTGALVLFTGTLIPQLIYTFMSNF